jgi:hypothetical protein
MWTCQFSQLLTFCRHDHRRAATADWCRWYKLAHMPFNSFYGWLRWWLTSIGAYQCHASSRATEISMNKKLTRLSVLLARTRTLLKLPLLSSWLNVRHVSDQHTAFVRPKDEDAIILGSHAAPLSKTILEVTGRTNIIYDLRIDNYIDGCELVSPWRATRAEPAAGKYPKKNLATTNKCEFC